MTDKELIRQEIIQLKNEQLSIFSKGENEEICGTALTCIGIYNQLLSFIDSLPEEHNEDLEEEIERCLKEMFPIGWSDSTILTLTYEQHKAFAHHFAEWQRNKDAVLSCKNLYDAIKEEQEKKNFHDDFEKASYAQGMIDGCIWQKQQMKEVLKTEYEKGRFDMREEMMKDAIECVVEDWCGGSPEITIPLNPQDFKNGDKLKIVIVKEE